MEYRDGREWVFARHGEVAFAAANFKSTSRDAKEQYLQTTPPSVHQTIQPLELCGFIERTPGQARSARVLVRPEHLPALE